MADLDDARRLDARRLEAARAWCARWGSGVSVAAAGPGAVRVGGAGGAAVAFAPSSLKQLYDAALRLARAAGCLPAAMDDLARAEARLAQARRTAGLGRADAPGIGVELVLPAGEAGVPWLPDLLALAGAVVEAGPGAGPVVVVGGGPPPGGRPAWRLPEAVLAPGPAVLDVGPALVATLHPEAGGTPLERAGAPSAGPAEG